MVFVYKKKTVISMILLWITAGFVDYNYGTESYIVTIIVVILTIVMLTNIKKSIVIDSNRIIKRNWNEKIIPFNEIKSYKLINLKLELLIISNNDKRIFISQELNNFDKLLNQLAKIYANNNIELLGEKILIDDFLKICKKQKN